MQAGGVPFVGTAGQVPRLAASNSARRELAVDRAARRSAAAHVQQGRARRRRRVSQAAHRPGCRRRQGRPSPAPACSASAASKSGASPLPLAIARPGCLGREAARALGSLRVGLDDHGAAGRVTAPQHHRPVAAARQLDRVGQRPAQRGRRRRDDLGRRRPIAACPLEPVESSATNSTRFPGGRD